MKSLSLRRLLLLGTLLGAALFVVACAEKPPRAEADSAEDAFLAAKLGEKCASLEYASAEKALAQARTLMREKKYKEAKQYFAVAKERSEVAKKKAGENPECQEKKAEPALPAPPQSVVPVSGVGTSDPNYVLQTIHFLFNSDELTEESRGILEKNAEWMKKFTTVKVVLEGHCDKRGSTQFNLSLGERRAQNVRKFLQALQVNPDLIDIVSYGKERPISEADSEAAYAENRRVEFKKVQ